jgi:thiol-disulfide isomerase/thioredoxin
MGGARSPALREVLALKRGPVVLTFYRGGWCPYCNLELRAYQRVLPEITATGASLVAKRLADLLPDVAEDFEGEAVLLRR